MSSRPSTRPSRGPRPSYVQKLVFSDDDEAALPPGSGSDSDAVDNEGPSQQAGPSTPKTRSSRAAAEPSPPPQGEEGDSAALPTLPPPAKKRRGRPPKDPSAPRPPPRRKQVYDSDDGMQDPTPPPEDDDDESGSAFDPGEVAEEEADVPMDGDDSASEFGGAGQAGDEDDMSDIVGGSGDDQSDPGSPRPGGSKGKNRSQPRSSYQRRDLPATRISEPVVTTTNSLPSLPVPRFVSKKTTYVPPLYKSHMITALNSEALPPLVPHFTSCLLEKPAFGKRSVVGEIEVLGGDRLDGGTEMSEGGMAERVRVVHEEAPGMIAWEGWSGGNGEFGEGWRPRDGLAKDADSPERDGSWDGVSGWDALTILSAEQASPYLPTSMSVPPKEIFAGLLADKADEEPQQSKHAVEAYTAPSLRSLGIPKSGNLINSGGPVRSLAWCPMSEEESEKRSFALYLAVSAHTSLDSLPLGHPKPSATPGSIQIWSIAPSELSSSAKAKGKGRAMDVDDEDEGEGSPSKTKKKAKGEDQDRDWESKMKLEMVLCVEGGMAWEVKWSPVGGSEALDQDSDGHVPRIGVLAASLEDGSIQLFAVPDPQQLRKKRGVEVEEGPLFVQINPLTTLEIDDGMLMAFDWGSGRTIAAGSTAGVLAVYNVREAVEKSERHPLPTHHIQDQTAAIRRVAYLRHPQPDGQGDVHLDWEQALIVTAAVNGRVLITDLRDASGSAGGGGASATLAVSRGAGIASATSAITDGSLYFGDIQSDATKLRVRNTYLGTSAKLASHAGQVWHLSSSDFHSTLASASADGSLTATGTMRGTTKKKNEWIMLMEQVFKVDHTEGTGELRLLDSILPQNVSATSTIANLLPAKKLHTKPATLVNTVRPTHPSWSPLVGVFCTEWNNACGIGRAGMLASGLACGFARVDILEGRWRGGGKLAKGKVKDLRRGLKEE